MKLRIAVWCLALSVALPLAFAGKRPPKQQDLPDVPVFTSPPPEQDSTQQQTESQRIYEPKPTNLVEYINAVLTSSVQGRDPVADRNMLLVHNDETSTYVHNTNHPAYAFHGFTGISVRGTGANCSHNGTLVSPRIVVTAGHCWQVMTSRHYYLDGQGAGAQWRFLDRDGKLHIAEAKYSRLLTNTISGRAIDTRMFVLKEPMPPSIEPALWGSPEMVDKAGELRFLPRFVGSGSKKLWPQSMSSTNLAAWYNGVRGGDSGSGSFVPIGTNLVLLGTFGGNVLEEGANWRETAEWLCKEFGYEPSIPRQVDVSRFK